MSETRTPSFAAVLRTQLLHLLKSWYAPTVLVLPLIGLWWTYRNLPEGYLTFAPWSLHPVMATASYYVSFAALLAAVLVWFTEPPTKRRYHWSMPVRREFHDLARLIAGAVWLIVAIIVFAVVAYFVEPAPTAHFLIFPSMFWLGLFIVPLLVYVLACVVSAGWNHALFWTSLIVVIGAMPESRSFKRIAPGVVETRNALFGFDQPLTLGTALIGHDLRSPWRNRQERLRVFTATEESYFDKTLRGLDADDRKVIRDRELGSIQRGYGPRWSTHSWSQALAVWYALGGLALFLALKRRPNV